MKTVLAEAFEKSSIEVNKFGADKITRYGWSVADQPGRFIMIDKTRLKIDHEYQRQAASTKVLEIARNWSWVACSAISVGHRDGEFWVIDGQYRTLAAMRRSDIKSLPCIVFETFEAKDEARGFLRINANRKPITSLDKFRAEVVSGDKIALAIKELLTSSGRHAATGSGSGITTAQCLTAMRRCIEKDEKMFRHVWSLICQICDGRVLHNVLVRTLFYIEGKMPDGESLMDAKWRRKLLAVGYDELLSSTAKAAGLYGKGGERTWAIGILTKLNYRSKTPLKLEE